MSVLPLTGETVKCDILRLDDLDCNVFIKDYGIFGYVENHGFYPSDLNTEVKLRVIFIDDNEKKIYLE